MCTNCVCALLCVWTCGRWDNPRERMKHTVHLEFNGQTVTGSGSFFSECIKLRVNGLFDPATLHLLLILKE